MPEISCVETSIGPTFSVIPPACVPIAVFFKMKTKTSKKAQMVNNDFPILLIEKALVNIENNSIDITRKGRKAILIG